MTTPAPATIRLLLVDDDPLVMSSLRLYFSTPAAAAIKIVGEATDGTAALDLLTTVEADVIMTDIHMPGMTGFDVLKQLRAVPGLADAPAFMCSADAMPDDLARARDAGFVGYWTKPIDFTKVFADLDRWVD